MAMLFKNSIHQESFDHEGFVVIDDFFNNEELSELENLLENFEQYTEALIDGTDGTINSVEKGIFFTRHFKDLDLEEQMRSKLANIACKSLKRFLNIEYKTVAALGIYKEPNSPESIVPMHVHHSNLAPGSALPGISMFAPLNNLDDDLGPLAFIKGSQKLWENDLSYSLTYMEQSYPEIYPIMRSYLTNLYPISGQAILFNQFTIHEGFPNCHKSLGRLALTAEFIPSSETCVLFLPEWGGKGEVAALHGKEVLKLPFEFSDEHRWVPRNLGEEVKTINPYKVREISKEEFLHCCEK
ncbi:MAG: phytanoyl-CoA dioxygenase family protein [Pseudomonadota bacterium]|nr:phytanoyl-CoA dioxygenase family protein [Pseudomonadota bacterium]